MQRRELPDFLNGLLALLLVVALGSCAPKLVPPSGAPSPPIAAEPPAPTTPAPPPPANALEAGISLASWNVLRFVDFGPAYHAFVDSCPALLKRHDASGLTTAEDWRSFCEGMNLFENEQAIAEWFRRSFDVVRIGEGRAFATGYYEPEIRGSRTRRPGYEVPIYGVPGDLVTGTHRDGKQGRGRFDEGGQFVLYHDRNAIEEGALAGRGLELAWAADPVELFFLQIQGSGRLRLPDGGVMRIGYAGQNGREYVAIGRLLKERGLLGNSPTTMQGIVAWLRANPEQGRAIMRENKSYVFFRELTGRGPLGAMGVPVTPRATVAADPKFVPLGAPVVLALEQPGASGLWVAQDTGGAIKGANRFDTFWGAGEEAARIAGGMQARGWAYILLPKSAVARLRREGRINASPQP